MNTYVVKNILNGDENLRARSNFCVTERARKSREWKIWRDGKREQLVCWNKCNAEHKMQRSMVLWFYSLCSVTKQLTISATMKKMRMLKQKTPVIVCVGCVYVYFVHECGCDCHPPVLRAASGLYWVDVRVRDSYCACVTGSICAACWDPGCEWGCVGACFGTTCCKKVAALQRLCILGNSALSCLRAGLDSKK